MLDLVGSLMKNISLFLACVLTASPLLGNSLSISIDPPPPWKDVTTQHLSQNIALFLEGPNGSSFVLTRLKPLDTSNHPLVNSFLLDVLSAIDKKSGRAFVSSSKLKETHFDNGADALFLRATLDGRPRLILAVANFNGTPFLALLNSSIPDLMLSSTLGAVQTAGAKEYPPSQTLSADGQLAFDLDQTIATRSIPNSEKNANVVLSLRGLESSLLVKKRNAPEAPNPKEEPALLKTRLLADPSVDPKLLSPQKILKTPAGPSLLYMSAGIQGEGTLDQKALGYLPWCYWGYSISSRGPHAEELIVRAFQTLSPGPSVLPKLLEETPRMLDPNNRSPLKKKLALGAAFVILLGYWLIRSKKRPTSP